MKNLKDIKSMLPEEIAEDFGKFSQKSYKASQVFEWLGKGAETFEEMTNISKELRGILEKTYFIPKIEILKKLTSIDCETVKYLFAFEDGETVEAVLMKYKHGFTVCISTQVGCKMGCSFCVTGKDGFSRNLTASEMLLQIEKIQKDSENKISNVVLMGMGEPLDNFENVLKFSKLITHPKHLNIGARHISVSTCGIVDKIYKLAEYKPQFTLSVSLHAADDETRSKIMKINRKWNIEELLKACKYYTSKTNRRISFEYAMIKNLNDSIESAKKLADILKGMLCHVNLIPVNNSGSKDYQPSSSVKINAFLDVLKKAGINTTIRRTLGADINASCGQLRKFEKQITST